MRKLLKKVKVRYPNIYGVLVEERNEVMAKRLIMIMKENPEKKIVAVVDAGHEEDIVNLVKDRVNKMDICYSFSFW